MNYIVYSTFDKDYELDFNKVLSAWEDNIHSGNEDKIRQVHNEYCDANGYSDFYIYQISDLDEQFNMEGLKPSDVLHRLRGISPEDNYFYNDYDGFIDLISDKSPVNLKELLSYLDNTGNLDYLVDEFDLDLESEDFAYVHENQNKNKAKGPR